MNQCPKFNNLHAREECPQCHYVFISGYDANNSRMCPSCKLKYQSNAPNQAKYRGTNNVYFKDGCPAIMSDGRFITYYNSSNELTEQMRKMNGFQSPNQFRIFMQNNADKFMDAERDYIHNENTCSVSTACSEGWHDLWAKHNGNWNNCN